MDNIINSILANLQDYIKEEDLCNVQNTLCHVLGKYNINEKSEEISPILDGGVNENIIKIFKVSKKVEGVANSSLKKYEFDLLKLFEFLDKDYDKITTNDIRKFLLEYQNIGKRKSNTTMNNMQKSFSSFYTWCQKEGYINLSPMNRISSIKKDTVKERGYTIEEMEEMLYVCRNSLRDQAILYTLYSTGCRVQELCNINIQDIDWQNQNIHIIYGKGGNCRHVPIDGRCRSILKRYILEYRNTINSSCDALFVNIKGEHNRLTTNGVRYLLSKISNIAGVNHAHPHRYRVTRITNLLKKGMNIQEVQVIAGHKNINTTSEYNRMDNDVIMAKLNMLAA